MLEANNDQDVYLSMTESMTLNQATRQRGEDESARRFRKLLQHMRIDKISDDNLELPNNRVLHDLPPDQRAAFDNSFLLVFDKCID